jgi:hypothetical protein
MNPMDVKRKVLQAVKGFGREGMGEELKKGYGSPATGKPAIAIKIESTKVEPEMGEAEDEMHEAKEGMAEGMHKMPGGEMMADSEMGESEMPEDGSKLTPEMLEMLLAKLGK